MASLVEFIVKIKDMASGSVAKLASNTESSFGRMERGLSRFTGRMNTMKMSIQDINKRLADLSKTKEISIDSRQIRRINREISELERRRDRLDNSGNRGGGGFGMGGLVGGALALAGVAGLGGVVGAGMNKSMTNTSFEVLAGEKQGQQLSGGLVKYAQDTIYGNEVPEIGKMMLSFGIQAQGVMPAVQKLGDLAVGNAEKFKSLGLVYSQVAANGRLMGQDNLQFINAGFNPLQELSRTTGKSMAVLKKEMEDGKISFADVANAIETATGKGGRFHNMTAKLADSAPGKLLGLQGAFEGLVATIGVDLLESMVPLFELGQWLIESPALLNGLGAAIAALTVGIGAWQIVMGWAAIKAWLLNIAVMWPVLVIAVLIGLIVALVSKYQGWGKAMQALWTVIKAWCSNVGIAFKDFFQEVGFKAELFWLKIKQTFQYIGGAIGNLMNAMKLALQFKFGEAKEALFAEIKTKATTEIATLEKTRGKQRAQNLADFAKNLETIGTNSKLIRLTEKKGGGKSADMIGAGAGSLAGSAGIPDSVKETNNGITGGGVKNLTINVAKFFDDLNINPATMNQGLDDMEEKVKEIFLRVVSSGNQAIS